MQRFMGWSGVRFRGGVALLLSLGLSASACSGLSSGRAQSCLTGELPERLKVKYSLGEIPEVTSLKFCEKEDRDGFSAEMSFVADSSDVAAAYLSSLGMRLERFVQVPPRQIDQLYHPKGKGWDLNDSDRYLTSFSGRDWNGECLLTYRAIIPEEKNWKGEVYLGMYCMQ
ncbi:MULTISPECIES: hypothetical protein [unclassified Streptomyces]|uniref:hypothetical protein n=1 Tax=unclassified Streptomyces TaxID=2593676 RepID=UPI00166061DE|nr:MULTISPECIES: hypothetical protein [unclassified Streptomyces]MBD0708038.1 hypothetical protein [Streptomyces sp. CBMA291]MBD0715868.1 hypothetical protein [Streptomyces sp. CBMA370]